MFFIDVTRRNMSVKHYRRLLIALFVNVLLIIGTCIPFYFFEKNYAEKICFIGIVLLVILHIFSWIYFNKLDKDDNPNESFSQFRKRYLKESGPFGIYDKDKSDFL